MGRSRLRFTSHVSLVAVIGLLTACDRSSTATKTTDEPRAGEPPEVAASAETSQPSDVVNPVAERQEKPPEASHTAARPPANRLADETSPYLLLHAHNPVDWFPWGPEALAKAKAEQKLIFVSIGYSSCYWCHVMERESFMDDEIAAKLNEDFVAIKIDREERPDIDEIYMTALQLYFRLVGSPQGGGWPLSMFLTPDGKPFIGGTYFPPRDGERGTGFLTVLDKVQEFWKTDRDTVLEQADRLAEMVDLSLRQRHLPATSLPGADVLDDVQAALAEQYDPAHGGFRYSEASDQVPKFPEPSNLLFLVDRVQRDDDQTALRMLLGTLEPMAAGGMRDHVGGGFHRYSTDRYWHIPHFEKMLYDNGQLATVYAETYALTGDERWRRIVEELIDFVLREMTAEQGGFYAALDAESDGVEGAYYAWDREELEEFLSEKQLPLVLAAYGFGEAPNFEERYVPLLRQSESEIAAAHGITDAELQQRLQPARERLLVARNERPRPLTDTKILCSWNGLMIRGLADAGRVFDEPRYVEAAARAADFALDNLRTDEGRLLRTYTAGEAKLNAYLDDYAMLVDGLIALHRATGDARWLDAAEEITDLQIELFWDDTAGGFFYTSDDHESLLARSKDPVDSALPSGNAVAADNLVYLAKALGRDDYRDRADETIRSSAPLLEESPTALPRVAVALAALLELENASSIEQSTDGTATEDSAGE